MTVIFSSQNMEWIRSHRFCERLVALKGLQGGGGGSSGDCLLRKNHSQIDWFSQNLKIFKYDGFQRVVYSIRGLNHSWRLTKKCWILYRVGCWSHRTGRACHLVQGPHSPPRRWGWWSSWAASWSRSRGRRGEGRCSGAACSAQAHSGSEHSFIKIWALITQGQRGTECWMANTKGGLLWIFYSWHLFTPASESSATGRPVHFSEFSESAWKREYNSLKWNLATKIQNTIKFSFPRGFQFKR